MVETTGPRWPQGIAGPRALVECDEPTVQDGLVRVLQEQGFAVATCAGPATQASGECPLVARGMCDLVDGADVVVHALDATDAAHGRVLASVSRRATSVIAELPTSGIPFSEDGCEWVRAPMSRAELVAALERATRRESRVTPQPGAA